VKSFLVLTLTGAALGLLLAWMALARAGNADETQGWIFLGGLFAFFGAKFGAIGWLIYMGVCLLGAVVDRAPAVLDQISKDGSK
jgi:hypothetical protein